MEVTYQIEGRRVCLHMRAYPNANTVQSLDETFYTKGGAHCTECGPADLAHLSLVYPFAEVMQNSRVVLRVMAGHLEQQK